MDLRTKIKGEDFKVINQLKSRVKFLFKKVILVNIYQKSNPVQFNNNLLFKS
jgi:hypothetical protein